MKIVTKSEAETMLKNDIRVARTEAESWFGKNTLEKMGTARAAVLVDMAYNLGSVRWPKLTAAIKQGDYQRASAEIMDSKYAPQVGMRAIRNSKIMQSGTLMNKQ